MNENIEPVSESEKTLDRIDARDRIIRAIEVVILLVAVTFSIVSGVYYQQQSQKARSTNIARQDSLKNYIKCLSLLRFDSPELTQPNVTRQQVSAALDKCASKE